MSTTESKLVSKPSVKSSTLHTYILLHVINGLCLLLVHMVTWQHRHIQSSRQLLLQLQTTQYQQQILTLCHRHFQDPNPHEPVPPVFSLHLLLARLMGQYCFARLRLLSPATLPASRRAGRADNWHPTAGQ